MNENKTWIEANTIIAARREYEIEQELMGSGSYNKKLADFIAKRDKLIEEEEPMLNLRREKLILAKLKKQNELSQEMSK